MDIFNKKKLKKEKELVEAYRTHRDELIKEITVNKKTISDLTKNNSRLIEENQKLIEWIEKILNVVGTADCNNKNDFIIPIYKESKDIFQDGFSKPYFEETIRIPEIIIRKTKF